MISFHKNLAKKFQSAMVRRSTTARTGKITALAAWAGVVGAALVWLYHVEVERSLAASDPGEMERKPYIEHLGYHERAKKLVADNLLDLEKLREMRRLVVEKKKTIPALLSATPPAKPAPEKKEELEKYQVAKQDAEQFLLEAGVNEAGIRSSGQWLFYAVRSPLKEDILSYLREGEDGEQQTFRLSGRQELQLDPQARKLATPFLTRYAWKGSLRYLNRAAPPLLNRSQGEAWEMRVSRGSVETSSHRLLLQTSAPPSSVNHDAPLSMALADPQAHRRVRLSGAAGRTGRDHGLFDAYVMKSASGVETLHISVVDNNRIALKSGSALVAAASTGDFTFAPGDNRRALLRLTPTGVAGDAAEDLELRLLSPREARERPFVGSGLGLTDLVISSFHHLNGRPQRVRGRDLADDRGRAWTGMLDGAINDLMREMDEHRTKEALPEDEAVTRADFLITVDPRLQGPLQNFLASQSRQQEWAITVMNEHGEILALADQPRRDITTASGTVPARPPVNDYQRLTANFKPHHVGSSGKPYLSAAAMAAHPSLAGAWFPNQPAKKVEKLLGYPLNKLTETIHTDYYSAAPGSLADALSCVRASFATSSDTFFMGQMILTQAMDSEGTALPEPALDDLALESSQQFVLPVRTGGTWTMRRYTRRPKIPNLKPEGSDLKMKPVSDTAFGTKFKDIFDVFPKLGEGFRANHRPQEAFSELFDFFGRPMVQGGEAPRASTDRLLHFLTGSAPENSRLLFFQSMNLRQDFLNVPLGGGDYGRWTNVELARCMTRLVTGRKVQARLVRGAGEDGLEPGPPPLAPLIPELGQPSIHEGLTLGDLMKQCAAIPLETGKTFTGTDYRGTAWRLGKTLRDTTDRKGIPTIAAYAKTGSFPNDEVDFGSYSMITFHLKPLAVDGKQPAPGITVVISCRGGRSLFKDAEGTDVYPAPMLAGNGSFLGILLNYLALTSPGS